MALITLDRGSGRGLITLHGTYLFDPESGRYRIEPDASGWKVFWVGADRVMEIREGRTMRAHCFHCWNDCEWREVVAEWEGRRLCDGCVSRVGTENVRRLEDSERWDRGPRD